MTRPQPLRGGVVVPDDLWEHREAHAGSEHRLEAEHIVGGTERGGDQFALEEAEAAVPESSLPPELTVVGGKTPTSGRMPSELNWRQRPYATSTRRFRAWDRRRSIASG